MPSDDDERSGRDDDADGDDDDVQFPPQIEDLLDDLESDRKKFLRDKEFAKGGEIQKYIGTVLYPRLTDIMELSAHMTLDTYSLCASTANEVNRLRMLVAENFKKLGVEVPAALPGVGTENLDKLQQAFYALGNLLGDRLPKDKEIEAAYNRCSNAIVALTTDLTGFTPVPEEVETAVAPAPAPAPAAPAPEGAS